MKHRSIYILFVILLFSASPIAADDTYQTPKAFIAESFSGTLPPPQTLSIQGDLQVKMQKIMGKYYNLPNVQYRMQNGRTAWILENIGKYEPITAGFVVGANNKLERIKVLIYRESHGWEVKHAFFTRQFKGAVLHKKGKKLDKRIDGISGATLSVDALKRMSALALLFHENVSYAP